MAAGAGVALPVHRQVRQVRLCNVRKTKALLKRNTNNLVKAPYTAIRGDSTIFYSEFYQILLEDKISYGQSLGILSVPVIYWSVTWLQGGFWGGRGEEPRSLEQCLMVFA